MLCLDIETVVLSSTLCLCDTLKIVVCKLVVLNLVALKLAMFELAILGKRTHKYVAN